MSEIKVQENREQLTAVRLIAGGNAQRLEEWARNIDECGADMRLWSDPSFVAKEMRKMAATFKQLGGGFYYHASDDPEVSR